MQCKCYNRYILYGRLQRSYRDDAKMMYSYVFNTELGKYSGEYEITLEENAQPKVNAPTHVAHKLIKTLEQKMQVMTKHENSEEVEHPTPVTCNILKITK